MDHIIIDTSSILFGLENKVDVFKAAEDQLGLKPVISKGVLRELRRKLGGKGRDGKNASVALELIGRYKVRIESDESYVDKWIIYAAKYFKNVCTNDTKLFLHFAIGLI